MLKKILLLSGLVMAMPLIAMESFTKKIKISTKDQESLSGTKEKLLSLLKELRKTVPEGVALCQRIITV